MRDRGDPSSKAWIYTGRWEISQATSCKEVDRSVDREDALNTWNKASKLKM